MQLDRSEPGLTATPVLALVTQLHRINPALRLKGDFSRTLPVQSDTRQAISNHLVNRMAVLSPRPEGCDLLCPVRKARSLSPMFVTFLVSPLLARQALGEGMVTRIFYFQRVE